MVSKIIRDISEKSLIHVSVDVRLEGPTESGDCVLDIHANIETMPFLPLDLDEVFHQSVEEGIKVARRELEARGIETRLWRVA